MILDDMTGFSFAIFKYILLIASTTAGDELLRRA